ncbi:hypothetical protein CDAR_190021 [Caerostris darwini]|uniref:Uncharacterized protein n=1 Tax=Caerostris darwini TaxID=1538125 RepID=A0AAV4QPJ9_9ARAC|nr:hypothetical protein CDAR_190021 [Caerostris darwini]
MKSQKKLGPAANKEEIGGLYQNIRRIQGLKKSTTNVIKDKNDVNRKFEYSAKRFHIKDFPEEQKKAAENDYIAAEMLTTDAEIQLEKLFGEIWERKRVP